MNAVTYALSFVKEEIPSKILELGLREKFSKINQVITIDEKLRSQVLLPTIIRDLNLNSFLTHTIDLSECNVKNIDPISNSFIIEVPNEVLGSREIVSVEMITKRTLGVGSGLGNGSVGSDAFRELANSMDGHGEVPIITSRLDIVGRNVILVNLLNQQNLLLRDAHMTVNITKDSSLKHLHPSTFMFFGELVTLAVKRYIHNKLVVSLDKGFISNGHEVSIVKDTIDKYEDASAMYKEFYRTKWQPIEFSNDKTKLSNLIGMQCGSIG